MSTTPVAAEATELDEGEPIARVEDLPDDLRAEIVAQREAGTTLAELKANFPQVVPDVIREVLPPANARERKARDRRARQGTQKASTQSTKPSATSTREKAISTAGEDAKTSSIKEPTAPKLVPTPDALRAGLVAARQAGFGRATLMEHLATIDPDTATHNVIWKAERGGKAGTGEIRPRDVAAVEELLRRIKDGELKPPERKAAGAGGSRPPREKRDVLEAKVDAVARLLHDNWNAVKPAAFRDQLAEIVGAPKPQEEAK